MGSEGDFRSDLLIRFPISEQESSVLLREGSTERDGMTLVERLGFEDPGEQGLEELVWGTQCD